MALKRTKTPLLILLMVLLSLGFSNLVNAEEKAPKTLDEKDLQELNLILDDLTDEVNEQLKEGKKEAKAVGYFKGEPFELSFDTYNNSPINNNLIQPMATRSSSFSVTLKNTAGFNFSHNLFADWSYDSKTNKISTVSADSVLSGPLYSKTHNTRTSKQTNSVHNVYSTGTFKAFKVGAEYKTNFQVRVNGTGTHQVVKSSIS